MDVPVNNPIVYGILLAACRHLGWVAAEAAVERAYFCTAHMQLLQLPARYSLPRHIYHQLSPVKCEGLWNFTYSLICVLHFS